MHVSVMSGPYWDGSERLMADWGSSGRRFKSCQPDTIRAGQKPFLSVIEGDDAGALDLVSATARYRRIFAWHEIGADLRVLSGIFPAYGGMR